MPFDITEAQARSMARKFENATAADLRPVRGRPFLAKNQPSVKAQAWMPKSEYAKLERKARADHTTVSAVLRDAVRTYL